MRKNKVQFYLNVQFCIELKEILLYGSIHKESAVEFVNALEEAKDEDIHVRICSYGGSVDFGFGMVSKFAEHPGKKKICIDGAADSMALYFTCYADDTEAYDFITMVLHRASYGEWMEKSDYFTDAMKTLLDANNKSLRKALESKIDVKKFTEITGVTLDQVFDRTDGKQLDVPLTAKQAKQIGLINKIISITPKKKNEINSLLVKAEARATGFRAAAISEKEEETEIKPPKQSNTMTLAELKAQHPEIYAEAVKEGQELERDRAGAWMAYQEIDPEAVKKGIESGKALGQKDMAEFQVKSFSMDKITKLEDGTKKEAKTDPPKAEATEKAKNEAEWDAEVAAEMGLKEAPTA